MKFIQKGSAPGEYSQWCASGNVDWQPVYDEMRSALKDKLKSSLIREQGGICCYCEQRLKMEDSHVEHVRPQHLADVDPLDFTNMACSCQKQVEKNEPRHCGNFKQGWYDESRFVSPFDLRCERAFTFTGDGRIKAASDDDVAANKTIEKLWLDISKLTDLREKAMEPFLDPGLSPHEIQTFADGYLRQNAGGHFNPFWTTIAFLFAPQHLATP